jgi:hypothetical protein
MKPSQHDISAALIKWISNQKVQDWRAVTFLYPRLSGKSSWEESLNKQCVNSITGSIAVRGKERIYIPEQNHYVDFGYGRR